MLPNLLLIGGTGKNIGKTEFSERLIRENSKKYNIIALKVTSIYPPEKEFHKPHIDLPKEGFKIVEEKSSSGEKDTSRMLIAGAKKAFFITAKEESLNFVVQDFFINIDKNKAIICESNSLIKFINPGLFIMVKHENDLLIKSRALPLLNIADKIIISDGKSFKTEYPDIYFEDSTWKLKKNTKN